jgi:preprotein translocase subunit SecD
MQDTRAQQLKRETVNEAMRTLERRVNQLGVAEPVVAAHGAGRDQILVQLPGVTDVEQAKRVLIQVARLSLHLVEGVAATREELLADTGGTVPPDREVFQGPEDAGDRRVHYLVRREPMVTGRDLKTARAGVSEVQEPCIDFTLTPRGAAVFAEETSRNVGRRLAIVLDEQVLAAPAIEERIGAHGQIRGRFTPASADELARVLRAGALPAGMRYLEERTIGPSLGRDSIAAGVVACVASMAFITAFMPCYYRLSGLNAVLALAFNLIILLAAMAWSGAALTLPGIAGVILTLGVGVDTNVLVFERIREELRGGKAVQAAVRAGFDRVWVTILDTHATALIAAAFLFQFGTGAIKGFAVTLVMGLAANVLASYFVSRFLFEWALGGRDVDRLSI